MTLTNDILAEAARIVNKGYTKGSFARTRTGKPCHHNDVNAVEFCMIGAIRRAGTKLAPVKNVFQAIDDALQRVQMNLSPIPMEDYNDSPTTKKDDVIKTLIDSLQKAGD